MSTLTGMQVLQYEPNCVKKAITHVSVQIELQCTGKLRQTQVRTEQCNATGNNAMQLATMKHRGQRR
jgi:hypothetical protein